MRYGRPASSTTSRIELADRRESPAGRVDGETRPERDRTPLDASRAGVVVLVDAAHNRFGSHTREAHGRDRKARLQVADRFEEPLPALLLRGRETGIRAPHLVDVA